MKNVVKALLGITVSIAVIAVTSCQVGLGESVDTDAPTISISSPENSGVAKGTFSLNGTWDDDHGLKSVTVSIKDTVSGEVIASDLSASIDKSKKTWSINLNSYDLDKYSLTNGWEYADGTYQAVVQAKDNYGHYSGENSRTFDIDNTAPVFAVTSPNSTSLSDPTTYGTILTFEGEVADDHSISSMNIYVYDENGTLKTTSPLSFSNVETTGGTSVVAATYGSNDELAQYYNQIYSGNGVTQSFYAVITLTDKAGNTSKCSYIKDDTINTVENKLSTVLEENESIETSDLKKILNGTYSHELPSNVSLSDLKAIVHSCAVSVYDDDEESGTDSGASLAISEDEEGNTSYLAFTLNSNANPTYEVVNLAYDSNSGIYSQESAKTFNIKVSSGLNGYKITPNTVEVELYNAKLSDGTLVKTDSTPYATLKGLSIEYADGTTVTSDDEDYKGPYIYDTTKYDSVNLRYKAVSELSTTVSNATYTVQLPKLTAKKIFIVEVTGSDTKSQSLCASRDSSNNSYVYGFQVSSSGKAATVNIGSTSNGNNVADFNVYGSPELTFSGTLKSDSAVITIDDNDEDYSMWTVTATNEADSNEDSLTWSGALTFDSDTVSELRSDNIVSSTEYNWYANDIWETLCNLKDSDASTEEEIKAKAEAQTIYDSLTGTSGARYMFAFTATVVNGSENSGSVTRNIHIDTEKPVVSITSVSPIVTYDGDSTEYVNGTIKIAGTITESNLDSLVYQINDDDAVSKSQTLLSFSKTIDTTEYTDNSNLVIKYWAVDKAGNSSDVITKTYKVMQSSDAPVINISNATSGDVTITSTLNMFGITSNNKLTGTVTDDDGISSIKVEYRVHGTEDFTEYETQPVFTSGTTSTNLSITLPDSENEYDIKFTAKDTLGEETGYSSSAVEYYIAVDTGSPVLTISSEQNAEAKEHKDLTNLSDPNTVTGKVSDGTTVTITREAKDSSDVAFGDLTVNEDGSWTDNFYAGSNGNTIIYTATDKYGNSTTQEYVYSIDSVAPGLKITNLSEGDDIFGGVNSYYKTSGTVYSTSDGENYTSSTEDGHFFGFQGSWNDAKTSGGESVNGSGAVSLWYYMGNDGVDLDSLDKDSDFTEVHGLGTAYLSYSTITFDLPVSEGNGQTFVFFAKDKAGNSSDYVTIKNIDVDYTVPSINVVSSPSAYYTDTSSDITLAAFTVSDTNGLAATDCVTLTCDSASGDADSSTNYSLKDNGSNSYSIVLNKSSESGDRDGKYNFNVTVNDIASRKTVQSFSTVIDTISPVLTVTSGSTSSAVIFIDSNGTTLKGSVTDTNNVAGVYYKVYSSKPESLPVYSGSDSSEWNSAILSTSGTWTAAIDSTINEWSSLTKDSVWYVYVSAIDEYNNASTYSTVDLPLLVMADSQAPSCSAEFISGESSVTDYVNSSALTFKATITDTCALDVSKINIASYKNGTAVESGNSNLTVNDIELSSDSKTAVLTCSIASGSVNANDGVWSFTVSGTDASGRSFDSNTSKITVDTYIPVLKELVIGKNTYAGSSVSTGTYENTYSVNISGKYNEYTSSKTGSGLSSVYYKVTTTDSEATELVSETSITPGTTISGSGTDSDPYVVSFSSTITVPDGNNEVYVSVYAKDKAGNTSEVSSSNTVLIDAASPKIVMDDSSTGTILVNEDDLTISGKCKDDSSKVKTIEIFIASESGTAVKTLTAGAEENGFTNSTVKDADEGLYIDSWSTTLTSSEYKKSSYGTSPVIYVKATDNAGNTYTLPALTLNIDETAPVVSLTSPSVSADINGEVTFTGKVSDANGIDNVTLYYSVGDTAYTSWSDVLSNADAIGTSSDTGNFEFTKVVSSADSIIGTTGSDTTTASKTMYLYAYAKDKAKNVCTFNSRQVTVNRNKDRPVIKINSLTENNSLLTYGTNASISGSITDDDSTSESVVQKFVISSSAITSLDNVTIENGSGSGAQYKVLSSGAQSVINLTVSSTSKIATIEHKTDDGSIGYDITIFNPSDGSWTFYPYDVGDGSKTMYFYVLDNGTGVTDSTTDSGYASGSVFYTTGIALARNYVKFDKATDSIDNNNAVTYMSDCLTPSKVSLTMDYSSDGKETAGTLDSITTRTYTGGADKRYVRFNFTAKDASGIAGITLELDDSDGNNKAELSSASNGTFTATTDSSDTLWTTGFIDLSSLSTDSYKAMFTITDQSGLTNADNTTAFYVDNTVPCVNSITPLSSDQVTGDITVSGSSTDADAGVYTTQWMVPLSSYEDYTDSELAALTTWNSIENTTSVTQTSWSVSFTESEFKAFDVYDSTDEDAVNYLTTQEEDNTALYYVPFYVKVTDSVGNYSITKHTVLHNPDANIPVSSFTYPTVSDYKTTANGDSKGYITLAGTIRASGVATDNVSVSSVYVQIDTDPTVTEDSTTEVATASGSFTSDDKTAVDALKSGSSAIYTTVTSPSEASSVSDGWWGIKASGTSSWSLTLNQYGEFNSSTSGEIHYIRIRTCAIDNQGNVGAWSAPVVIAVDNSGPEIGSSVEKVYRSSDSLSTITAKSDYTAGMDLKDQWYLAVSVADESGIDSTKLIVQKGTSTVSDITTAEKTYKNTISGNTDYLVYIPIDKTSEGSVTYTISATDTESNGGHTSTKSYTFNIDNTAPELSTLTGNGNSLLDTTVPAVQNDNYIFTLAGQVKETNSGYGRMAFYFMRNNVTDSSKPRVYDVMNESSSQNIEDLDSETVDTVDEEDVVLYGKTIEGTTDGSVFTPSTADDVTDNSFVREGGIVLIDGIYRTITEIDDDGNVSFTPSTEATESGSTASAFFAYAQVVDNTSTETSTQNNSDKSFTIEDDDGDNMPERVTGSTSTQFTWNASMYSDNIPDGPVTLVCVAFDNAGNISTKTVETSIKNNAPRLARIYFGTDIDGNSNYSSEEFNKYTFNSSGSNSNYKESVTFATSDTTYGEYGKSFIIKKGLAVIPELTGGNGDIVMVYNASSDSSDTVQTVNYETDEETKETTATNLYTAGSTAITADFSSYSVTNNYSSKKDSLYKFLIEDSNLTDIEDGSSKAMSFTFWDSTDGTVCGTDSNYCFARVTDFTVDLVDGQVPMSVIDPFYWESASSNSVYKTESTSGDSELNGHIELEDDLPETFTAESGEYDGDPKVSGKITFNGSAYDDVRLGSIWVHLDGYTPTATYSDDDKMTVDSNVYYKVASYDSTKGWTKVTDTVSTGFEYSYTQEYLSQSGHKVNWTISVDTSLIENTCDTDVNLKVIVKDHESTNTSSLTASGTSGTDSSYNKPVYQMDVVPYITEIETSNRTESGLKNNNIRSANGKYSVIKGSTEDFITVSGYNLNPSAARIVDSTTAAGISVTASSGSALTVGTTDTETFASVGLENDGTYSGCLELFVNGVRTLNNINNNDAHGTFSLTGSDSSAAIADYKNMSNREADYSTTKNVTLTDDRYIRFFDMKDTGVDNGYYPTMIMNGDNPVFGYVDKNGGSSGTCTATGTDSYAGSYYPSHAMPQRSEFNGSNAAKVYTEYLIKASTWDQMGMAVDEDGRYYNVSVYNRDGCAMSLVYDRYNEIEKESYGYGWGAGVGYTNYTGDYSNYTGNNAITLENVNYGNQLKTERFQHPQLIAKGKSKTSNAYVYMAYFDAKTKEICFRDFQLGTSISTTSYTTNASYQFNYYNSTYGWSEETGSDLSNSYVLIDGNYYALSETYHNRNYYYYTISGYSGTSDFESYIYSKNGDTYAISDSNKTETVSSKLDSTGTDKNNTVYAQSVNFPENTNNSAAWNTGRLQAASDASNYFALAVTSDYHVIIVYYDESSSRLKMLYSTNAVTGSDPTASVAFTASSITFPEYVGNYVSMCLDSKDGIHISAFDSGDSDLSYIFVPSYSSTGYTHYTVDQYGSVGNWTQIKINSANQPVIAYTNATENGQRDAVKLAYAKGAIDVSSTTSAIGTVASGIDTSTNYTTGNWEYMTVPAITPPQGGDNKFQNVCLDFDSSGRPVVGYLGTNLEFGKWLDEEDTSSTTASE